MSGDGGGGTSEVSHSGGYLLIFIALGRWVFVIAVTFR